MSNRQTKNRVVERCIIFQLSGYGNEYSAQMPITAWLRMQNQLGIDITLSVLDNVMKRGPTADIYDYR